LWCSRTAGGGGPATFQSALRKRKAFFSEKTFINSGGVVATRIPTWKSFLFLFFKKESAFVLR
jgi:hypothetical protein